MASVPTDQHLHEVRSGNPLWWATMAATKTDPRETFRAMLNDYSDTRKGACKKFNSWFKRTDHAARAARRTRTLESDEPPAVLQPSLLTDL